MQERSPAQIYALVFGALLVVAGIVGFFYSSDFGSPGNVDDVFGILAVNGWHNLVHIAIAIWGFIIGSGDSILGFIPVNTEDNFLHLLIGIAGVGAGLATPATQAPTTGASSPAV